MIRNLLIRFHIINALDQHKNIALLLLIGIPGFYLLTFASLVEESEIQHVKKELTDNLNRPNLRILLDLKNVRRMSTNALQPLSA